MIEKPIEKMASPELYILNMKLMSQVKFMKEDYDKLREKYFELKEILKYYATEGEWDYGMKARKALQMEEPVTSGAHLWIKRCLRCQVMTSVKDPLNCICDDCLRSP